MSSNREADILRKQPKRPDPTPAEREAARLRLVAADAVAFLAAIGLAFYLQSVFRPVPKFIVVQHVLLVLASVPVFALGAGVNKLYLARANQTPRDESGNIVKATAVGVAGMLAIAFAAQYEELSRLWVLFVFASVLLLVNLGVSCLQYIKAFVLLFLLVINQLLSLFLVCFHF